MALKLDPKTLRVAFAKLRGCLVEGLEQEAICERLGLEWADVEELRRRYLDHEAEIIRHKPTEHTYVEYCIEQRKNIKDLDKVVNDYQRQSNPAGYVGAVRARADLLNQIIAKGQEFGFIERKADAKGYAAGEAIKGLSNPDFRKYIFNEIQVFNTLQLKYGDRGILEVEPGPLYIPQATRKFPVHKTPAHKRNRVYGGRQVLRDANG
jgi:hypothetical protein